LLFFWKSQPNSKIDLDFIYEMANKMNEDNGINVVNHIINIVQNENMLVTQYNQLCDFTES